MNHSIDYFKDEIRCGFYVPTAMKQAWAAALDVLEVIDKICERHGIKYFADWGTLLGAVRHGGFVPWDDDLDICMLRDDYIRFRKVADEEMPVSYVIHDYERQDNHWLFLSRVVNNSRICFEEEYLESHNNFPWLAGVDIFVKDYLFTDESMEKARDKEILGLIALADGIREGSINRQQAIIKLADIENKYDIKFSDKQFDRDMAVFLYRLAEQQMSVVSAEETDKVGQIFPWVLKNGLRSAESKNKYDSFIRLPFEDTTIPVPAAYNTVLSSKYGDYCKIKKVWDGHDYPYFESQKANLEKVSGEALPSFKFSSDMLVRPEIDNEGALKTVSKECLAALQMNIDKAEKMLGEGKFDRFAKTLEDSQQLAAEYGTFVEKVKGNDSECATFVTDALQKFCDALWEDYQSAGSKEIFVLSKSRSALTNVTEVVNDRISSRREILFLPVGAVEWKAFNEIYRSSIESNTDVYVVPLPVMKKSFFGDIQMTDEEIRVSVHKEDYPEEVICSEWADYDISVHCPDVVYIQNPYDSFNPCLTVPPDYYAGNIRKYSKKLIYIPIGKTAEFGINDVNDLYNMKHYVTSPGVIYADEVYVQSDNIRNLYIRSLSEFAGKETEPIWADKIRTFFSNEKEAANAGKEKRLVYCIGANELKEHPDAFIDALKERLEILDKESADFRVFVTFFPDDRGEWGNIDPCLSREVFKTVEEAVKQATNMEILELSELETEMKQLTYDGYYGSPSPIVSVFMQREKPVMLAGYAVRYIQEHY